MDVVVGGDSHTLLGPNALTTMAWARPSVPTHPHHRQGRQPVCVVQAWEYAQVVGELKVSFNAQGEVTQCTGTPHVLIGDSFTLAARPPPMRKRRRSRPAAAATGVLRITTPSAPATTALQPFKDRVAVFNKTQVAMVPQELCSRRVPGGVGSVDYSRSSAACNAEGSVSLRGGDIQQLVAQAYLDVANEKYGGADITLQAVAACASRCRARSRPRR